MLIAPHMRTLHPTPAPYTPSTQRYFLEREREREKRKRARERGKSERKNKRKRKIENEKETVGREKIVIQGVEEKARV